MKEIESGSSYLVTEDGKVFSRFTKRVLKNSLSKSTGYYVVNVIVNGKRRPEYVHRLVAKAYLPNPDNLPEVNHKDCNKLNNHKDNLEWVTQEDNIKHSVENKLPQRGEDHYKSLLTEGDVHKICELLTQGWTSKEVAENSGVCVSLSSVMNIRTKRDWAEIAVLYSWKMYPERAKSSTTSRKA